MPFPSRLDTVPGLKPVFVVFIIYSSWALLSVMTGVVSENMIAIREQVSAQALVEPKVDVENPKQVVGKS